jgi:7,8-dihydropterin-6-yl-methyl-4-(beta-D-ribofuranosyl)aminobenzene 5'-phosphate synthase
MPLTFLFDYFIQFYRPYSPRGGRWICFVAAKSQWMATASQAALHISICESFRIENIRKKTFRSSENWKKFKNSFHMEAFMKSLFIFIMCSLFTLTCVGSLSTGSMEKIQITILYDNYIAQEGVEADWGFACLIEGMEKKILFDTGTNGDLLLRNAKALNADLDGVELVVISHDHGDHTGGLLPFLAKKSDVSVYLLTAFRDQLFQEVKKTSAETVAVKSPIQICQGVHTTGEMGIQIKEQALLIDTSQGIVLITGCAHPGIVDIVKKAKDVLKKDIHLVFGGFHLVETPSDRIERIIAEFKDLGVRKVGATHCTGDEAIEMFKKAYGENFVALGVGRRITVDK